MSIYGKESYSQSKIVNVIGPIETWWNTEEEPDRFNSSTARRYFYWRRSVCEALAEYFLVYRPHEAFKGPWNEGAQEVNDVALRISDFVVNLKPEDVVALGTDHEDELAHKLGKPVFYAPVPDGQIVTAEFTAIAKQFAKTLDMAVKVLVH